MKRSTAKVLMVLLNIVLVAGGIAISVATKGDRGALLIFAAVIVVVSLFLGRYLRCPHCGRGQGKGWLWASYCPHCGESLDVE